MKKTAAKTILILIFAVLVFGFGNTLVAVEYEEMTIEIAHVYPQAQPEGRAAIKFKEFIEEQTGGAVQVSIFPDSQLGSQVELAELRAEGAIDIDFHGVAGQGQYDALFFPYLFEDDAHIQRVLETDFAQKWSQDYTDATGGRMLGVYSRGFRHFILREKIEDIEGFRGVSLRVPELPALVAMVEAWGASPTPVPWAETYNALMLGTVDGVENTLSLIYTSNFHDLVDYVLITSHSISPVFWIANNEFYEGLSEELKDLVDEGIEKAIDFAVERNQIEEEEYKQNLIDEGITIIELEEDSMQELREAVQVKIAEEGLSDRYWDEGIYEQILDLGN